MSKFKRYFTLLFLLSALGLTGCGSGGGGGGGSTASSGGGGLIAITCSVGSTGSIVGSWNFGSTTGPNNLAVITFFNDGTYMLADDGDPVKDPTGQDGMERGTYEWSSTTGAFKSTTTVNTDGQWGLSAPEPSNVCMEVIGNKLTFTDSNGSNTATRIIDVANSIVGTWYNGDSRASVPDNLGVYTFFDDGTGTGGTYTLEEDGPSGPSGGGGQDGMERGTYTYNTATKAFTSTCPSVDTNGEWGLSHPIPGGKCTGEQPAQNATITISGTTATLADNTGPPFTLNRVAP